MYERELDSYRVDLGLVSTFIGRILVLGRRRSSSMEQFSGFLHLILFEAQGSLKEDCNCFTKLIEEYISAEQLLTRSHVTLWKGVSSFARSSCAFSISSYCQSILEHLSRTCIPSSRMYLTAIEASETARRQRSAENCLSCHIRAACSSNTSRIGDAALPADLPVRKLPILLIMPMPNMQKTTSTTLKTPGRSMITTN